MQVPSAESIALTDAQQSSMAIARYDSAPAACNDHDPRAFEVARRVGQLIESRTARHRCGTRRQYGGARVCGQGRRGPDGPLPARATSRSA